MSYVRCLLVFNDEILCVLQGEWFIGEIYFGMQEDFGELLMLGIFG